MSCRAILLGLFLAAFSFSQTPDIRELKQVAEGGDAAAENNLGAAYHLGRGVPQDYAEAIRWFRKAADQGNAKAQDNLGMMYDHAQGVPQDYAEAVRWYRKAADQGYVDGQYDLGVMYYNGNGIRRDYAEAGRWFRKAADQGNPAAQNNLGWIYEHGQGVPRDAAQAVAWYRKAAEQGISTARENLERMARIGRATGVSSSVRAAPTEIVGRRDEPLQIIWFTPKKPPTSVSHEGMFHADRFSWKCYPVIAQNFNAAGKGLILRVDLNGPGYWSTSSSVLFTVDGEITEVPIEYNNAGVAGVTPTRTLGGYTGVQMLLVVPKSLITHIATAKDVWVTVPDGNTGARHSIKLSESDFQVFQDMLERYQSLPGEEIE